MTLCYVLVTRVLTLCYSLVTLYIPTFQEDHIQICRRQNAWCKEEVQPPVLGDTDQEEMEAVRKELSG